MGCAACVGFEVGCGLEGFAVVVRDGGVGRGFTSSGLVHLVVVVSS